MLPAKHGFTNQRVLFVNHYFAKPLKIAAPGSAGENELRHENSFTFLSWPAKS
jgi:hypothetical protein